MQVLRTETHTGRLRYRRARLDFVGDLVAGADLSGRVRSV